MKKWTQFVMHQTQTRQRDVSDIRKVSLCYLAILMFVLREYSVLVMVFGVKIN